MKYSVLTYIFGGGELLRDFTPEIEGDIEYICVTDDETLKSDVWKIIVDEDLKQLDPLLASFYVRHHPFKYVSGDICMRLDGSVQIKKSLLPIFQEFESLNKDMCLMTNSRAKNIFIEMMHWQGYENILLKQMSLYGNAKVNIYKQGSLQTPIIITKNNELVEKCDQLCWEWIEYLQQFDSKVRPSQALFTGAVAATTGLKLMFVDESFIQSDYLQWFDHNSNTIRQSKKHLKHEYFFEQPVEIHTFE